VTNLPQSAGDCKLNGPHFQGNRTVEGKPFDWSHVGGLFLVNMSDWEVAISAILRHISETKKRVVSNTYLGTFLIQGEPGTWDSP